MKSPLDRLEIKPMTIDEQVRIFRKALEADPEGTQIVYMLGVTPDRQIVVNNRITGAAKLELIDRAAQMEILEAFEEAAAELLPAEASTKEESCSA